MDIKEYKELVNIITYDNVAITTDKPLDTVLKILNSWVKFVIIDGIAINTSDVRRVEPFIASDIKQGIVAEKNLHKREVMQYWYDKREKENKPTKGLAHLLQICEDHGWQKI